MAPALAAASSPTDRLHTVSLVNIFTYLDQDQLMQLAMVRKRWHTIWKDDTLWFPICRRNNLLLSSATPSSFHPHQQQQRHYYTVFAGVAKKMIADRAALVKHWKNTYEETTRRVYNNMVRTTRIPRHQKPSSRDSGGSGLKNIKLVMIGDGAVGKTCSMIAYCTNAFPTEYIPTVFDNYAANVMLDGRPCNLDLRDTTGTEDVDRHRPLAYPQTDIFIIMFSVISPQSLLHVADKWLPEITHHCPGVPWILVGNKTDLLDEKDIKLALHAQGLCSVPIEQAQAMATKLGAAAPVMYCSAKTGYGLKEIFENAMRTVLNPSSSSKNGDHKCVMQ